MAKGGDLTMWDRRQFWREAKKNLEEHVQRHDDEIKPEKSRGLPYVVHPLAEKRYERPAR